MHTQLTRLFQHMAWADKEIIATIKNSGLEPRDSIKLLAHIIAAEYIWLSRIKSRELGQFTPWTTLSLEECTQRADEISTEYLALTENLSEENLRRIVTYKTTKGDEMHSSLNDILMHVALHGSYHRGQIASILKNNNMQPPPTDYIMFCRKS